MMMLRRALVALALLCLAWMGMPIETARANCATPCTKAQVTTDITTNWPDNTTGAITPALLRSTVLDLLNSYIDANGSSSFTCPTGQYFSAIATLSTFTCTPANLLPEPQGRLTLQANTPVMTTTQSAQTTLRYDCYIGNQVPYYTGTADAIDTVTSCEATDAMVSAASAGQVVSGQVYDVWWVHSGANRICLAMSTAAGGGGGWASDTAGSATARGTGYSQLDRSTRPYTTNKNAIANCFNGATNYGSVAVNQATYLGTVLASANGQISWTLGASASGGTAAVLGVWNMYNRVSVGTTVTDSGATYTYTSATVQQARASAGNQIKFVLGLAEDAVLASYFGEILTTTTSGSFGALGLGFDTTSAFSLSRTICFTPLAASLICSNTQTAPWIGILGLHTLSANEASDGTHAATFDDSSQNYLSIQIRM